MRRGLEGIAFLVFPEGRRNLRRGREHWKRPYRIGWRMGLRRRHGSGIEWLLWRCICCGLAILAGLSVASAGDLTAWDPAE